LAVRRGWVRVAEVVDDLLPLNCAAGFVAPILALRVFPDFIIV